MTKLFSCCLLAEPRWRPMRIKIHAGLFVTKDMEVFTALILYDLILADCLLVRFTV